MRRLLPAGWSQSLRWRLLGAICAVVLLMWSLTGWFGYNQAQHEAEELMDGSLAQTARLLLAITRHNEDDLGNLLPRLASVRGSADDVYEPPLEFQIGLADGTIVARSADAPVLPILGVAGYSDIQLNQFSWRILNTMSDDGQYRIQVAQLINLRDQAALEVATQTVLPQLLIVPLLVLVIYWSISRTLRPLDRLAGEVAARSPDNLAALAGDGVPSEVRPLVSAINRLFRRVDVALDNQRRFTADAAHELRTPLAALKIQAQVAQIGGDNPIRDHALQQISLGVDRAGHLIDQLLRLAQLDPLEVLPAQGPVDLGRLIEETLAQLQPANPTLRQRIVVDGQASVPGDASLLGIALRNLVDNALRYTPPDSPVHITIETGTDTCTLLVRDHGPGVSPAALDRLGERFFRADQAAGTGNGLGLAIVGRIAALHGARLVAENLPSGGLAVGLRGLPLAGDTTEVA